MTKAKTILRRDFLLGAGSLSALTLAGCTTTAPTQPNPSLPQFDPFYVDMYGPIYSEPYPIPAVDLRYVDPAYYRRVVDYPTTERPGTIVVDTAQRYLYLVRDGGQAMRYGVGIGREGFSWSGGGYINHKKRWPTWTPPSEMIAREPELEKWRNGQPPGIDNPLGARALYIFEDGRDTLYRLHGTPEPWTIGKAVSSGCVRLMNQDVIDLYDRVAPGSPIRVI
ncbi:L,D-transpeptidase [Pelagibacterium xiamenense]|uniref:L,D-transpeptidase n=1 Tax=Pelagibacterium xiamenense TaxID=2901140 RepID=UPI001E573EF9|nr:L,D-transpeptidase [Pelagibacterium xiamenense]MCD7060180.1 L,D-transpeptidase [Pelagibacterium xiamenense]